MSSARRAQAKRMAAAAKAAAAAKGSGQQRDEEQQPLMQQPGGVAVKGDTGGVAKASGEGRATIMAMPGRVAEQRKSDAVLPISVRVFI